MNIRIGSVCWLFGVGVICLGWQGAKVMAEEAEWLNVIPQIETSESAAGAWEKSGNELKVSASNGARIVLPVSPKGGYDFRISFTRHTGQDSIVMMFVQGGKQAVFEVDAWGQHLSGVQLIDGQDLRNNPSRTTGQGIENGRKYKMTIEVRADHFRCLLNETEIAMHRSNGSDLSMLNLWELPEKTSLGIGAWKSDVTFHTVEVRPYGKSSLQLAKRSSSTEGTTSSPGISSKTTPAEPAVPPAMRKKQASKHVLIVIANQDFFYREYAEPRAELERAGIRVSVAAGVKSACRPHANSGQGNGSGVVQPDLSLAQVNVENYDAVLFSGGWGSSSYQYAFNGRYDNRSYNGNPAIKREANRIVNEFLAADKYTCALCNAVSVLAWARVNGKSPLAGIRACAPTRQAASGIYNGRQAQPSCRWHPEANGAIMSPAGSIGRPNTAADDVLVDGKIITGEDDISAREMGRRIAQVLGEN